MCNKVFRAVKTDPVTGEVLRVLATARIDDPRVAMGCFAMAAAEGALPDRFTFQDCSQHDIPVAWAEADSHFSRLCSEIARVLRYDRESAQDIAAYGAPSECAQVIWLATRQRLAAILDRYSYSPEGFYNELQSRIGPKAAYFSGLDVQSFFFDDCSWPAMVPHR